MNNQLNKLIELYESGVITKNEFIELIKRIANTKDQPKERLIRRPLKYNVKPKNTQPNIEHKKDNEVPMTIIFD
jgi:hypothetical protein